MSNARPIDAFQLAKHFIKKMPLEDVQASILNAVHNRIWMAAPWRWTLGTLAPVNLAQNVQDYPITPPSNLLYLLQVRLLHKDFPARDLEIVPVLPPDPVVKGQPSHVSLVGNTLRVSPVPATVKSPAEKLLALYKKSCPQITRHNANTPGILEMPDEWFWVYELGVLAYAYMYADDQRAGSYQMQGNQFSATGAFGQFESGIQFMRQREPLPTDSPQVAPETKITVG